MKHCHIYIYIDMYVAPARKHPFDASPASSQGPHAAVVVEEDDLAVSCAGFGMPLANELFGLPLLSAEM